MKGAIQEGDLLDGQYRIGRRLGRGAMGEVFAARHVFLHENVAIKVMTAERSRNEEAIGRFLREARASRQIKGPHVVRVLNVTRHPTGTPYIVMEYLEGMDLQKRLDLAKPVPLRDAASWVIEACDGIGEAHRLGIVHRDIKPANLFLVEQSPLAPTIKVLDFGISKNTTLTAITLDAEDAQAGAGLTDAEALLGTPSYMAPEQMDSAGNADCRSDVWSLGVTLFELLTGELPFPGLSWLQVYSSITERDPVRWRALLDPLPTEIRSILARCLTVDRPNRIGSAGELALALAPFANADAANLALRLHASDEAARERLETPSTPVTRGPRSRSGRVWAFAIALIGVTLAVALGRRTFETLRPDDEMLPLLVATAPAAVVSISPIAPSPPASTDRKLVIPVPLADAQAAIAETTPWTQKVYGEHPPARPLASAIARRSPAREEAALPSTSDSTADGAAAVEQTERAVTPARFDPGGAEAEELFGSQK